jgi:hypothetical protein
MPPNQSETDVEKLHSTLGTLDSRQSQLTKEMKAARRKTLAKKNVVAPTLLKVAQILCCLPAGGLELAILYLVQKAGLSSAQAASQQTNLESWFDRTPEADRHQCHTLPPSIAGQAALQSALLFVDESKLEGWVREQNMEKGIAPASTVVWNQRERQLNANLEEGLPKPRPAKQKHRLQWVRRWRLRWRIKMGKIAAREYVSVADCQNKAEIHYTN